MLPPLATHVVAWSLVVAPPGGRLGRRGAVVPRGRAPPAPRRRRDRGALSRRWRAGGFRVVTRKEPGRRAASALCSRSFSSFPHFALCADDFGAHFLFARDESVQTDSLLVRFDKSGYSQCCAIETDAAVPCSHANMRASPALLAQTMSLIRFPAAVSRFARAERASRRASD